MKKYICDGCGVDLVVEERKKVSLKAGLIRLENRDSCQNCANLVLSLMNYFDKENVEQLPLPNLSTDGPHS